MKTKGLIFDLDGVIVFTDELHYQAWKKLCDELDIYFDWEINNKLRGVSRMDSLNIILENSDKIFTLIEKELLAEKKNEYYKKLLNHMTPADVSDEVRTTLKELRKRGYKLSIGSSSKNAKFILEKVDLLDAFDVISDGNNITKSKPDPEVFLKGAELLCLQPKECAVIEDSYAGIDAAIAAQMIAIAIGEATSYGKVKEKLRTFADILPVVGKLQ